MNKENLLAIDCGTQSVRALLFDPSGNILAKEQIFIQSYYSQKPGWAEQDVHVFWQALCDAATALMQKNPSLADSIAGMSLTTQRSTLINLDKNAKALRPAIVWPDQRRVSNLPHTKTAWNSLFRFSGLKPTIEYLLKESEAIWIKNNQPQIWEKTEKFLFLSGYLHYKLCGEYVDSVGSQVGYIPFNYKAQNWAGTLDWKWKFLPIEKKHLPKLIQQGKVLGQLSATAAKECSLPAGLPIIASAADKACEVIGSGVLEPETGCLSYGTAATINTITKKYLEVIRLLPAYPAAIPNRYNVEVQVYRGFWMVSWFIEQFACNEQDKAAKRGISIEEIFDEMIDEINPGSDGLILQPYWSPGLRHPGPEAKGAIVGFGDQHTRLHLYRAILEGIAFALKEGAERIFKKTGLQFKELRVSGGGSQSNAAMQLTADIFDLPAIRPHTYETSGLGAAINAAVGLSIHSNYETAIRNMTRTGSVFEPHPQNKKRYQDLYEQIYLKMYPKLRPLYKSLKDIIK
jgi:sugar (pentulose or hexulose) kinase